MNMGGRNSLSMSEFSRCGETTYGALVMRRGRSKLRLAGTRVNVIPQAEASTQYPTARHLYAN